MALEAKGPSGELASLGASGLPVEELREALEGVEVLRIPLEGAAVFFLRPREVPADDAQRGKVVVQVRVLCAQVSRGAELLLGLREEACVRRGEGDRLPVEGGPEGTTSLRIA